MTIGSNAFSGWNPFAGEAGVAGGYGGGAGMPSWFPIIASMVSQLGAGIAGSDNQAVKGINTLNQQAIGAKSKADIMQKLLGGQVPGGKISIDEKGTKISLPPESGGSGLGSLSGNSGLSNAQQGSQLPGGSGIQWNQQNMPSQVRQANPFVSSQPGAFSYADLAGLNAQDITEAFGASLQQQQINQQSVNSVYENMYKEALATQAYAQAGRVPKEDSLDKPFPVPVYGKQMTLRQWNALPPDTQAYNAYVYQSQKQNPDEPVMNEREWKKATAKETKLAYLQGLMDEPELKNMAIELAKAGSGTLEENVGKRKAFGEVDQELKVTDPDYIPKIEAELKKDAYSWRKRVQPKFEALKNKEIVIDGKKVKMSDSEARRWAEKSEVADDIQLRLERQFGKDKVKVDLINDEFVWTVDGKVVQRYK